MGAISYEPVYESTNDALTHIDLDLVANEIETVLSG